MAKKQKQQSSPRPIQPTPIGGLLQQQTVTQVTQTFQGPIPHPTVLEKYDQLVPGAAERILAMAERESAHRQALEKSVTEANISAQNRAVELNEKQNRGVFRSDWWGQLFGFLVSGGAVVGSVVLALHDQVVVAAALAALPLAGIIRAFRDSTKK